MMITGAEMTDLKTELDIADVWNDVRVMLPSYETTIELLEDGWHRYPVDIVARAIDGNSINRYGRRTKTQSKHVIEKSFAEAYCAGELAKYKEPFQRANLSMVGNATILSMKIGQPVTYVYAPAFANATAIVDSLTLDIDMDGIPRLSVSLTDATAFELADLFNVRDEEGADPILDRIDSVSVIG